MWDVPAFELNRSIFHFSKASLPCVSVLVNQRHAVSMVEISLCSTVPRAKMKSEHKIPHLKCFHHSILPRGFCTRFCPGAFQFSSSSSCLELVVACGKLDFCCVHTPGPHLFQNFFRRCAENDPRAKSVVTGVTEPFNMTRGKSDFPTHEPNIVFRAIRQTRTKPVLKG